MLRILTESLLCGLPIILLFLSLYQISSWKIDLFRWGIVILRFSEPFPFEIPTHLIDEVVEYKGITFKFVSQKLGLFQATVIGRNSHQSSRFDDYPLVSGIFPLLGEIVLDEASVAKVTLRIPNSIIFLFICILIALFGFTILSNDFIANLLSTIMGIFIITILIAFLFFVEKTQLHARFQKIKEYILEDS